MANSIEWGWFGKAHTHLNKKSNSWYCISEQKPSPGVKITVCRRRFFYFSLSIIQTEYNLAKLSNWWRRALIRVVTNNLMVTLVELHDRTWKNLQKDKHHCNTQSIWSLWQCGRTQSSLQCRHMKTHLEFAKKKHLKGPSDCEKSDEPQFQASIFKESRHCSSPAEYHPKSKVRW